MCLQGEHLHSILYAFFPILCYRYMRRQGKCGWRRSDITRGISTPAPSGGLLSLARTLCLSPSTIWCEFRHHCLTPSICVQAGLCDFRLSRAMLTCLFLTFQHLGVFFSTILRIFPRSRDNCADRRHSNSELDAEVGGCEVMKKCMRPQVLAAPRERWTPGSHMHND